MCHFLANWTFCSDTLIALFIGFQVEAIWIAGVGCQITKTHNEILAAIFIYSMCFDFIVLVLTVYKLIGITYSPSRGSMGRGRLTHMIFTDGLIFFILACVSFTGVLRIKGSVAHLRILASCPISLLQYS